MGINSLDQLGEALLTRFSPRPVAIVTDSNLAPIFGARIEEGLRNQGFESSTYVVPAGEESKCLTRLAELYEFFANARLERSSFIVALGGGVIGDLAGMAAATYLRGVPVVQVGTTVVAQVDSSIGGKVGINLPQGKNLVGAFNQPAMIWSDVTTLTTLSDPEFVSGMAEVVKSAVIRDASLFELLEENAEMILAKDPEIMLEVVTRCAGIKANVVAEDEREGGLRQILNFGHTMGHALETIRGYGVLRHGEAVSIGMVGAARLGKALGMPDIEPQLVSLLSRLGLPLQAPFSAGTDDLLKIMSHDKKVRDGKLVFVLPVAIGEVEIKQDVSAEAVAKVLPTVVR